MAERPATWPSGLSTTCPQQLTRIADSYPDIVYAEVSRKPDGFDYVSVTYRQLNNAVNALAWWIERTIGIPDKSEGFPTMVYMGPNDLMYPILLLGAVKVGYKMMFPTPRYNAEGLSVLIQKVESKIMLVPSTPFPVVQSILEKWKMDVYQVPELFDLLNDQNAQEYPYTKIFEQARTEPLVALHTSGTTGFPKPIIWNHDMGHSFAKGLAMPVPEGFESTFGRHLFKRGARMLTMMPPFHASGVVGSICLPFQQGTTLILPPSGIPPTSMTLAAQILDRVPNVDIIISAPPYVEELGLKPELLDQISQKVQSIAWFGGSISLAAGNAVSAKTELWTDLGSTEVGFYLILNPTGKWRSEDWEWSRYHPALNLRFDHVSNDIFEAVIVRNPEWNQPVFKVFPDLTEYRTGDLLQKHPTRDGLWKHHGRTDDLITFITADKFHPTETERRISSNPAVAEALLVGTRRPKASLILRLTGCGTEVPDDVWSLIEDINKDMSEWVKIGRDMILVVQDEFLKTAKGTVRRQAMSELYEKELDKLYYR